MKRLLIFIFLLVLLAALPAWGATYYVSTTGSNTSPYETWAKAALLPSTAVTAGNTDVGGDGPHIMYIAAGTYDSRMVITDADWTGAEIIGAGMDSTILAPTATGQVCQGGTADNVTLRNLTLRVDVAGEYCALSKVAGADGWVAEDVCFSAGSTADYHMVQVTGATMTFRRCRFRKFWKSGDYALRGSGTSGVTAYDCIFEPPVNEFLAAGIWLEGSGASQVSNSIILNAGDYALYAKTGTFVFGNNFFSGGLCNNAISPVTVASGTVQLLNNSIIQNIWDGTGLYTSGTFSVDTGNIVTSQAPQWKTPPYHGYIVPCVDDTGNFAYAQSLATALTTYSMKGTFFLSTGSWSGTDNAALRQMVADGVMEPALHGRFHTSFYCTHALNFAYAGTDTNPTVAFTAGGELQLRTTEGNDNITLDTTAAAYDSLSEVIGASNGQHNWTVIISTTGGQDGTSVSASCRLTSCASMGATAAPCDLDFNLSGYTAGLYKDEITDPKAYLADTIINGAGNVTDPQTGATYVCQTWASPFHDTTPSARTALIGAGLIAGRGEFQGTSAYDTLTNVADVDLYTVCDIGTGGSLKGSTEAQVRASARALGWTVAQGGLVTCVLAHDVGDLPIAQWEWVLDEWSRIPDLTVTSMQLMAATIRAAPWTDDGDGTYSRTYTNYTDYHLLAGSPCINAGTDLGDDYDEDYDGLDQDSYGGAWEIGAYA